jgi:2-hydroxychromene-2-carboxylate isomerase
MLVFSVGRSGDLGAKASMLCVAQIGGRMASLEFFFDYGSPYSYLADTRLAGLSARSGQEVTYRPMLLGGVFKATGNQSPFVEPVEAKRAYFSTELTRWVRHLDVAFAHNAHFPINTLTLMRTAHAARALDVFKPFHEAIYPAFWTQGADLGKPEIIVEVLNAAGLEGQRIVNSGQDSEVKAALRATTEEAVERGVFGAPTFFVDGEMFFGNDRLEFVEAALGQGAAK